MSVSARDRKAVIYSEVERLRALLDLKDQQLAAKDEEIERLRAQLDAPSAQPTTPEAPRAQSTMSPARARMEMTRRLAVVCKATVKWAGDQGFQQYKHGAWVPVPAHMVNYATKGLEA